MSSAVEVRDVTYQNITGTSASKKAITFNCSESHPCQGIVLTYVNLMEVNGGKSEAECDHINFEDKERVSPDCP
ncbi:Polygalacturonase-like [Orobanche minor]